MLEGESSKGFNNKNKGFFCQKKRKNEGVWRVSKKKRAGGFFPTKKWPKEKKGRPGFFLQRKGRVLKNKIAGEFFPTKKWSKWRVLREQERGEWPEGFSLKELAKRKERRKGFGGF